MFLNFLTTLLLLTLVLWLLAMVAGTIIATPLILLDHHRGVPGIGRPIIISQVFQSVFFAALVAFATVAYTANRVANTWPYGLCAFLSTYFVLSTHAYETGQPPSGLRAQVSDPIAVHKGAVVGSMLGLVAFVIVYLWPSTIRLLPGVSSLISLLVQFSERVSHLWVIRIVLLFVAIAYFFKVGFLALLTTAMAVSSVVGRIRAQRRPRGQSDRDGQD